ncbi:Lacunin, partial [Operophtera brumata]
TGSTETLSTDDLTTDTDSDETGPGSTTDTLIDDTDSTLSSDDLIARSGTGSTETLSTDDLTTDTDSDETGSGSTTDTLIDDTADTPTGVDETTTAKPTDKTTRRLMLPDDTDEFFVTTEASETTESGPTDTSETTEASGTTESGPTDTSETTEASGTTESGPTDTSETTEASGTTESGSTDTSETTEASETTESGSTDTSETTEASGTTESGPTDTSETTEASGPTESGTTDTEASGTTESGPTDTSETTEASGTTESGPTDTSETTEASGTTESGPTDTSETTEASETTESGPTDTSETTEASETTESGPTDTSETTEASGTTVSGPTDTSETTEASGPTESGPTDTSETTEASGSTESGSTDTSETTQAIETTESGSTNTSETTEASDTTESGSTDTSETTEAIETTESGSTDTSETTEASDTTESGSTDTSETTEASGTTESGSTDTSETTEAIGTTESGSTDTSETTEAIGTTESVSTLSSETVPETEPPSTTTLAYEGCEVSEFGCCFDNVTEAAGPDQQGCPCDDSKFGCCFDGVSPAFEGCLKNCNASAYGCCPDGESPAHGPNREGCCLRSAFGCCPDNYNFARGPHLEGCACHAYQFGCCSDGVTIASGPDGQGCHCIQSKYKCCGDGETHATGPNHEGCDCSSSKYGCCPDGHTEATGPKFQGCTDAPEDKQDACKLPQSKGACLSYNVRWYYDSQRESCTNFGSCVGNFPRWGFNQETRKCEQFTWGGCEGNPNRFSSEAACTMRCDPPGKPKPECSKPQEVGNCSETEAVWSFSQSENRCVPFYYTGCGGNDNRFSSLEACEDSCPGAYGEYLQSGVFFRTTKPRCRQFYYGGCGGNTNKFNSEQECQSDCQPIPTTSTISVSWQWTPAHALTSQRAGVTMTSQAVAPPSNTEDVEETGTISQTNSSRAERSVKADARLDQLLPNEDISTDCAIYPSMEACSAEQAGEVWYLNVATRECTAHQNLADGERCRTTGYPLDPGACSSFVPKYFFNETSDRCEQFAYGGCLEPGNCLGRYELWYYEERSNRFESRDACEGRCLQQPGEVAITTTTTQAPVQPVEPECTTPDSLAPCGANETVFYYDAGTSTCRVSGFGGCRHPNSYGSEEECERRCGVFRGLDVCRAQVDPGPCRAAFSKYFFDAATGACKEFVYGGCQGGPNRFSTEEECKDICEGARPPAPACLQEVATGESCGTLPSRRWHYSPARAACLVFAYQGCGGNDNNFVSYEECADVCNIPLDTNARDALCEPYKSECYALESRCEYGIRVTMAYDGCQHCSCEEPPNCERERQECERLRCPYGVDRTTGDNDAPQAPQASTNTEPNISEEEGGTATLKCIFHGNPPPKITWRFGEITIDGNHDRYRLLSDDNTNEVPSECQPFEEHCARLSCPYGLQKTKMPRGCVRCSCVQVEVNCTVLSLECDNLKCNYGVERIRGDDGCERCKCMQHPCANKQCPEMECCVATPYRDAVTQENRYMQVHATPVCEQAVSREGVLRGDSVPRRRDAGEPLLEKVGSCPADGALGTESACRRECNDDADCRAVGKCCSQGCSRICLNPVEPTTRAPVTQHVTTYNPDPVIGPAFIAGEANVVIYGELDQPLEVRCQSYGHPTPAVYWYKGLNGPMVPIDNPQYEARGQILTIRKLSFEMLGEYACYAYNGQGKPATWVVTVKAYQPDDNAIDGRYLVPQDRVVFVTPREPTTDTTTTTTTTTQKPEIQTRPYIVEVHTELRPASTSISAGAELSLPCDVDGYPEPRVTWTKDGAQLAPTDRMWITDTRLTIPRATISDSGEYRCHASNQYSTHSSTVQINVQGNTHTIPRATISDSGEYRCHASNQYSTHSSTVQINVQGKDSFTLIQLISFKMEAIFLYVCENEFLRKIK